MTVTLRAKYYDHPLLFSNDMVWIQLRPPSLPSVVLFFKINIFQTKNNNKIELAALVNSLSVVVLYKNKAEAFC